MRRGEFNSESSEGRQNFRQCGSFLAPPCSRYSCLARWGVLKTLVRHPLLCCRGYGLIELCRCADLAVNSSWVGRAASSEGSNSVACPRLGLHGRPVDCE
jgi:hypothetical protein